jgi:rubrerythrin
VDIIKMELNTVSAMMGFAKKLEDDATRAYEQFAEKYPDKKEIFLAFAKEGEKNKTQFSRVYQEIITDQFVEACFSCNGIFPEDYETKIEITTTTNLAKDLSSAIEMEDKAVKFYRIAAEQLKTLLKDISRAFEKIVKIREDRESKLKSLR